jgi:hypothetical protein
MRLWNLWDPYLKNISQIPKPHGSKKTTLCVTLAMLAPYLRHWIVFDVTCVTHSHNILEQGGIDPVLWKATSANTIGYLPTIPGNDLNSI